MNIPGSNMSEFRKKQKTLMKFGLAIWIFQFLVAIGLLGAVVFVGAHFLAKYW